MTPQEEIEEYQQKSKADIFAYTAPEMWEFKLQMLDEEISEMLADLSD